jgi:lipoyl(octanoyl) transferase
MHGFAFNARTDLSGFGLIVPCGIREYEVTSLEKLRGRSPDPEALAPRAAELLCERFGAHLATFTALDGQDDELADAIGIHA